MDLLEERQFERALAVFAEAVRRSPPTTARACWPRAAWRSWASASARSPRYHACAEGLLRARLPAVRHGRVQAGAGAVARTSAG